MSEILYIIGILLSLSLLGAMIFYILVAKLTVKKKIKKELSTTFGGKDEGDSLKFKYRGYDIIATFRGEVKLSIVHNCKYEKNTVPPKGMKFTPLYLTFRVGKKDWRERLEEAIDFLQSME